MRIAIISDIHSNLQALTKCFKTLDRQNIDEIICLGDIVGYNANPKECIRLLRSNLKVKYVVKGNHDHFVCKNLTFSDAYQLSKDAYDGIIHSQNILDNNDKDFLNSLKYEINVKNSFFIKHSAPFFDIWGVDEEWFYLLLLSDVEKVITAFNNYNSNLCFFGHTHLPTFVMNKSGINHFKIGKDLLGDDEDKVIIDVACAMNKECKILINPGSIGQPRKKMSPSYAIFDEEKKTVEIIKFKYNNKLANKAVKKAGYSTHIAERILKGE